MTVAAVTEGLSFNKSSLTGCSGSLVMVGEWQLWGDLDDWLLSGGEYQGAYSCNVPVVQAREHLNNP
jgi:hypothetical protein